VTVAPRFGLAYDVLAPGVELAEHASELLQDAELAEALGFDSLWFGETHRNKPGHGHCAAPLIAAAAVAARTQTIQIGTAVLLLPAYTPLQVAEQAALVDQLSGGRLLLGVAPGLEVYRDYGYQNFGFGPTDLQPIMDESLDVIRALWSKDRISFEGGYYRYVDAACYPRPRQAQPPLLVGGITRRSIQRAVTLGDGWVGGTPYPFALIREVRRRYLSAVDEHGVNPGTFALIRPIVVADSNAEAERLARDWVEPVIDYYLRRGAYFQSNFRSVRGDGPIDDAVRREAVQEIPIVGDPERCAEQLRRYHGEAGVDHFILRIRFPGQDDAARSRLLRLIAEEVLPRARDLAGSLTFDNANADDGGGSTNGTQDRLG
jgi:alkanesulfonate monooxygenase SsuD/methylene tetrahydromethanopterin reductase-like flavin-dependent oxidoreductase (luciferase family)